MTNLKLVTPEYCREILLDSQQKKLDLVKTYSLRDAILNDEWNPELHQSTPVVIRKGKLHNGHHRIFAILLANTPVECYVKELTK